jgi:hypothetical protein
MGSSKSPTLSSLISSAEPFREVCSVFQMFHRARGEPVRVITLSYCGDPAGALSTSLRRQLLLRDRPPQALFEAAATCSNNVADVVVVSAAPVAVPGVPGDAPAIGSRAHGHFPRGT